MVNSAEYLDPAGQKIPGYLDERDGVLAFRAADGRVLFQAPYSAVGKVALPTPGARRMRIEIGGEQHTIRLTDHMIDGEEHSPLGAPSGSGEYLPDERDRQVRDNLILAEMGVRAVGFVAADRVRRRRIRNRIAERTGGPGDGGD